MTDIEILQLVQIEVYEKDPKVKCCHYSANGLSCP